MTSSGIDPALLPVAEMGEDVVRLHDVGDLLRPAGILADERLVERRNRRVRVVALSQRVAEKRRPVRCAARAIAASRSRLHARDRSPTPRARTRRTPSTRFPFACAFSQRKPPDE